MSSTSLLLVPLPPSKANPDNDKELSKLLSGEASTALTLSAQTKSANADEECFFKYLNVLKALDNSPLVTVWTDPFQTSKQVTSKTAYAEMANTLWNFISYLQNQILALNASSNDELKKIRACIGDTNALIEDFKFLSNELSHPVFTPELIGFIESYNKYVNSLLFLSSAQNSKNSLQITRVGLVTLNYLRECEAAVRRLNESQRTYFSPFIDSMVKYYNGLIYFEAGNDQVGKAEYGKGLSYYRRGLRLINGFEKITCAQSNVATATKIIATALKSAEMKTDSDNKRIYSVFVPDDPPDLPQPFKLPFPAVDPTPNLLIFITNGPVGGGYETNIPSIPGTSNSPQPPVNAHQPPFQPGYPQTPNQDPSGGPPFQPGYPQTPNQDPSGGPPVFTPMNGPPSNGSGAPPVFTPQFGNPAGGPPVFTPMSGNAPPPQFGNPSGFQGNSPPVFTPMGGNPPTFSSSGPPAFNPMSGAPPSYPQAQPQGPPQGYPSAPPQFNQYQPPNMQPRMSPNAQQGMQQNSMEKTFPTWAMLNNMKANIMQRMQIMKQRIPAAIQIIDSYAQQAQIAAQSDGTIADTINKFIASAGQVAGVTKDGIDSMIGQAVIFYQSLDDRLDQIEQRFQ
ncbi:hypothetical protein TRFO_11981 [Tritrichomonas foetus]|uniref:BRO1 domain-containing protein n=1 Tax=Tritrichomonas foetus TaxID=1144522 RepID=A0A1J4J173_9EUKA|nr:hypothetical protein TRFO_11981 [Tritrichomonas foetus]|eukprot:OHS93170.1 hypothetical protein TRFO_11981 [Tritrichomonas foetus]